MQVARAADGVVAAGDAELPQDAADVGATVLIETKSAAAISVVESISARRRSTSSSRGLSGSMTAVGRLVADDLAVASTGRRGDGTTGEAGLSQAPAATRGGWPQQRPQPGRARRGRPAQPLGLGQLQGVRQRGDGRGGVARRREQAGPDDRVLDGEAQR